MNKKTKSPRVEPAAAPADHRLAFVHWTLLDDPLIPARMTMDEAKLEDLMASIRQLGILEPIVVEEEGGRYRVHAGHRRTIAARALQLEHVPAHIYAAGKCSPEAIKSHENAHREELNVAEEAQHFQRLLDNDCGGDVDRLCSTVAHTRDYVERRLILLAGDPAVFRAVAEGHIVMGVAAELNQITNPLRRKMYLDSAITSGAAIRTVRAWRIHGNREDAEGNALTLPDPPPADVNRPVAPFTMTCLFCQSAEDQHDMEILYAHRYCQRLAMRKSEEREVPNNGG